MTLFNNTSGVCPLKQQAHQLIKDDAIPSPSIYPAKKYALPIRK